MLDNVDGKYLVRRVVLEWRKTMKIAQDVWPLAFPTLRYVDRTPD
jgi:hypothetical protein